MILKIFVLFFAALFIYDRYIQREHQLLINYPVIGRFRYFFEMLREPFRQYFGDEEFYESKDKIDWVYASAHNEKGFISFAPSQPMQPPKYIIKHSNSVLNMNEVSEDLNVVIGEKCENPFFAKSIIIRSAMSDGAISPEGTRAFVKGAYDGKFPINTGEGGLTSNFFFTFKCDKDTKYMEKIILEGKYKKLYIFLEKVFNRYIAIALLRKILLPKELDETYIFDYDSLIFFRPDWSKDVEDFPKSVPDTLPDIIFQIGSGLYGVRDKDGNFDEDRYKKIMSFCRMTEIKIAQGAKQTGGKLIAKKVTPAIAYYRGVEPYKDLFSPNRFPYAETVEELFDFIGRLQKLSKKPVGIKIVISSKDQFLEYVLEIKRRVENKIYGIPDFISIDGGDGGSATAPLYLMDRVGLNTKDAIYIADRLLKEYGVRDKVKLIASSKILNPDDIVIIMCLGADLVQIGRGFMMSAGCIRAKVCSGEHKHQCPVGLATQDKSKRKSYLVYKQAGKVVNYHNSLLKGVRTVMAVMGVKDKSEFSSDKISFIDKNGFIHEDVNRYFDKRIF